ncbi:formyltetrahydrofolate deformylase [Breoghania corrubedonensis]|uniref:Formyltetrahydrofolate deformylase n=1 Tax=Breoghania corrubedonensis TaxID=665038 RepID=A0A2T5VE37_9HYPH|nr:formyltetrahydrofolate deformylase [Breoghania corrubedonensis]PTW62019.1 formyltetrahydrofolate deformylase [Breoghania corrubedonensis]
MTETVPRYVLKLQCPDRPGIVAGVASALTRGGGNILESAQFDDLQTGLFFMRVCFTAPTTKPLSSFEDLITPVANAFGMDWALHDEAVKPRILIMVSKFDHCLQDLAYRWHIGSLPAEIVAIVSNHEQARSCAEHYGLPFHHWPVTKENKAEREAQLIDLIDSENIDLVVLARYMQVLSEELCGRYPGKIINIHHSFLPAFKGAAPYSRAHERGVKLIGATGHYVTTDLDEGPIIEQHAERVTHANSAAEFVSIGRGIESRVLTRAVIAHCEHRVFINGIKTVVFS